MYVNSEDWDVDFAFPNFNVALFLTSTKLL